jgi:dihydrofolate reductase
MADSTFKTLIAVLQVTADGRILDGGSEWVDSWADGLELEAPVDTFILGAGMFAGYAPFWGAMLENPSAIEEMIGRKPYPREIAYAKVASETEHLVLSTTAAQETEWPSARIVRSIDEIRSFKEDGGHGTAYVVGGPTLIKSLLEASLLDELRLIVRPVLAGHGELITDLVGTWRRLEPISAGPVNGGALALSYRPSSN